TAEGARISPPGLTEVPVLRQLDEDGLDAVMIEALYALADLEVGGQAVKPPELPVQPVALVRARRETPGEEVHPCHEMLDPRRTVPFRTTPSGGQVAPARTGPSRQAQPVDGTVVRASARGASQGATHALGRRVE